MSFFTGKGDEGTTKLFDTPSGTRISKSSTIFECLGQLDELNSIVGWARVVASNHVVADGKTNKKILREVQDFLFTIQAEVAGAPKSVPHESVIEMSSLINTIESQLPEVKTFLVAGGSEFSARLDIARAISRRAERRLVTLHESGDREIAEYSRAYMNRLSSLLYALTRWENHTSGIIEEPPQYKDA